jgi:hypothetical protein
MESQIAWHPAFVEAIQLELETYKDSLEFHPEYQLTSEPLRIDCVVIKKTKDIAIKKNIAAIFRKVNLLEYKSPDDYVSVADFYKVYGYACLYASFEKTLITDLTMTFVESHHPKKLLEHLKNIRGYEVEETRQGIYTVNGDILPIQLIDSRQLSANENLWLKGLSNRLDPFTIIKISEKARRQDKTARIQAYMNAIAKANARAILEAMTMSDEAITLDEVFEKTGLAAKWETRGEAIGEARGRQSEALDIAKNMINSGFSPEMIAAMTKLDPEKVKELYQTIKE